MATNREPRNEPGRQSRLALLQKNQGAAGLRPYDELNSNSTEASLGRPRAKIFSFSILNNPEDQIELNIDEYIKDIDVVRNHLSNAALLDYNVAGAGIDAYIPKAESFEKDINGLTAAEKGVVQAFARALTGERYKTAYDPGLISYAISDLAYSGRLGELFSYATTLAQKPPAREPQLAFDDSDQSPAERIVNRFAYWLQRDRMHLGVLRSLNQPLYEEYYSWKRSYPVPPELEQSLVTKKTYNDRLIASPPAADYAERHRRSNLRAGRKR